MKYYAHNIGDYAAATAHLSILEDGLYRRMLDWYYLDEQPLPADKRAIYKRIRASSAEERQAVDDVLAEFFHYDSMIDCFRHSRCEAELFKIGEKSAKASESAHQRWDMRSQDLEHANGCLERANALENASNAMLDKTQDTRHKTQEKMERASRLPDGFPSVDELQWAQESRSDLDARFAAAKFRDYWVGVPGARGRKLDWPATWRNFIRSERARPPPGKPTLNANAQAAAAIGSTRQPEPVTIDEFPARRLG